ncbi:MAG: MYXO-CTERM sorting domain-containing protein, partial [Myxococcota bacterium]
TLAFDAGGDTFVAVIPDQADGQVIEYQIDATLDSGEIQKLPANLADRWYQRYVGPVTPLVCADFETDPMLAGWTLDVFEWGVLDPRPGSDDPTAAFAGTRVLGIELGADSDYENGGVYRATMPAVDVSDFETVRLQYRRWLNVDDAQFDQAKILADGAQLWINQSSFNPPIAHRDREWRFHDVDLSPLAQDGRVQVSFELTADDQNVLGGWNLDDVCIVVPGIIPPDPMCGEEGAEPCEPDDMGGGCCSTSSDDATGPLLLGVFVALLGARRRKITDGPAVP